MIEALVSQYQQAQKWWDDVWELRDKRVDGWPMLDSPLPTVILVLAYVYIVTVWGPRFMKDRKPYNISTFLVYYNFAQVVLSAYIFITLLFAGWGGDYSFRCQPVDYSSSPKALMVSIKVSFFFITATYSHFNSGSILELQARVSFAPILLSSKKVNVLFYFFRWCMRATCTTSANSRNSLTQ